MGVAHMLALRRHAARARALRRCSRRPTSCCSPPTRTRRSRRSGEAIERPRHRAIAIAEVAADPRAAAPRALDRLDHDHLLVHFDVDVVDFVDLPLSENTGLNIGLPFATARAVLDVLARRPARRHAHGHRAQPARTARPTARRPPRSPKRSLWREGAPLAVGGFRPEHALLVLLGPDHVHDRVDQRQVGERLREVAEVAAGARVDLLGVEPERAGVATSSRSHSAARRARARRSRPAPRPARTSRS